MQTEIQTVGYIKRKTALEKVIANRSKMVFNHNWRELPLDEQKKIYRVEQFTYSQLYMFHRKTLKKYGKEDRNHENRVIESLTILFMRFICRRKFGMNWFLLRKEVENFIRKYNPKEISYLYFMKHYRDNPEVFEQYFNEFCQQFNIKLRVTNTGRINPATKKMMEKNRVGGGRYAGIYI
jgi:hypothetical protein